MEINGEYIGHINTMRDLYIHDKKGTKATDIELEFEKIYKKAYVSNVNLKTSQNFISELNNFELGILQQYSNLENEITPNNLTPEGAYNLLMHHFERYDFNDDGFQEIGTTIGLRDFTQEVYHDKITKSLDMAITTTNKWKNKGR